MNAAPDRRFTGARTFPELLTARLSHDPGQPVVTAYDEQTGERTELSMTTYANWVAKTANLFVEELGLDAGDTVLLDLPPHWLVPVFLGGAWSAGLAVTTDREVAHAALVCGPDPSTALPDAAHRPDHVVACSLLPFAVRFADPLPPGVLDYGLLWPGQADVLLAFGLATPDTPAWRTTDGHRTQAELLERASGAEPGVRLLTDAHPAASAGVPVWLGPLLAGGSLVLVQRPRDAAWPVRHEGERASAVLRAAAGST